MAISEAEKIRKAEEIYYRRNGIKIDKKEKKKKSFFRVLLKDIFLVAVILAIFYVYTNKEYFTSEKFYSDVKNILNTEINFKQIWNKLTNNQGVEKIEEDSNNKSEILKEEEKEITNEDLKLSYTYIMPLNGVITSEFGYRASSNSNVEGNHTGIDIAGNVGDKIVSSTYGKVIEVSSQGYYGNHLKIENGDIITLYAHCNQIYVSKGDIVVQGQEIAEVGMTGNTTGPHLHFEIRKNNEFLNPLDYIGKS